jgi:hypothetical protein
MHRFLFVILFALTVLSTVGINSATAARYCLQGRACGYPGNCHFSPTVNAWRPRPVQVPIAASIRDMCTSAVVRAIEDFGNHAVKI